MNDCPRICPHCGYDLIIDTPIMINDFSMNGTGYPLMWRGLQVRLPPAQALLCWSLMKSYPRQLSITTLLDRVCDDVHDETSDNLIRVHVSRVRATLKSMGAPNPIRTMRNAYVWEPRGVEDETTDDETVAA